MGWDPVPWFIGGQAEHSVNVARNVAHAAFDGQEGIVTPTDLEVRELDPPALQVQVLPGTVAIKNRADTARDEMFVGRLYGESEKADLVATDSTGGKSYLIVARVENPYEGDNYTPPADPTKGPYIFTRVLGPDEGVTGTTTDASALGLGDSMVALARIDMPASTGAITQDMIKDLRKLSREFSKHESNVVAPTAKSTVSTTGWSRWGGNEVQMTVNIPEWATHVKLRTIIGGAAYGGDGASNVWGSIRMSLAGATATLVSQTTAYNLSAPGGSDRTTVMAGSPAIAVPAGCRGKPVTITLEGYRGSTSTANDYLWMDAVSMVSFEADFERQAESSV